VGIDTEGRILGRDKALSSMPLPITPPPSGLPSGRPGDNIPRGIGCLLGAMVWGRVVWGDLPTLQLLSGAALVVAGGLYILHREVKLNAQRRRDAIAETSP